VYAKVIVLDLNEHPIEKITGRVTQGSISVDGTSAVRRTCSLTLVAQDVDINELNKIIGFSDVAFNEEAIISDKRV
jgi:hypothetical protein